MTRLSMLALIRTESAFEAILQRIREKGRPDHPWLHMTFEEWRQSQMLDEVEPPDRKS